MTHQIRLTDHWTRNERDGQIVCTRHFGSPRTIAEGETVWFAGLASGDGVLSINGGAAWEITADSAFEFQIGDVLMARNVAVIEFQSRGEVVEASLQIKSA